LSQGNGRSDIISPSPKRIFQAADAFLYFARGVVGLAFGLELGIASHFAPLDLLGCALDSIFIHPFSFDC
jgi:hypothetical protein